MTPHRFTSKTGSSDRVVTSGIYHVYHKIVLGQLLMGPDRHWGQDFSHRKE